MTSPAMIRLSHDIFKHILTFKDPRYERVRNGDPYMATPTRVWITEDEFKGNATNLNSMNILLTSLFCWWTALSSEMSV